MSQTSYVYCEMCGQQVPRSQIKTVFIEGSLLNVCPQCYAKIMRSGKIQTPMTVTQRQQPSSSASSILRTQRPSRVVGTSASVGVSAKRSTPARRSSIDEKLELVEDYAERIRKAREKLGWSQRVLAEKVKVSENVIKRIESGRLRPTIDLARRLEEVLGIKLLVPSVDQELTEAGSTKVKTYVTLGEILSVRNEE